MVEQSDKQRLRRHNAKQLALCSGLERTYVATDHNPEPASECFASTLLGQTSRHSSWRNRAWLFRSSVKDTPSRFLVVHIVLRPCWTHSAPIPAFVYSSVIDPSLLLSFCPFPSNNSETSNLKNLLAMINSAGGVNLAGLTWTSKCALWRAIVLVYRKHRRSHHPNTLENALWETIATDSILQQQK